MAGKKLTPHKKIRIVFCHFTSDVCGGSDRSLFDLVTHLPEDRFKTAIILKTGDPMAKAYREAGVEVTQLNLISPRRARESVKFLKFCFAFWPSVFRMASAIRRFDADMVHVNTITNIQGAMAARLARKPLVWHVREYVPNSRAYSVLCRLVAFTAARAVAISDTVAGALKACDDRLTLVYNGIDLSEYDELPDPDAPKNELGLTPTTPVVTTIGRLEHWKGQHVLIEAIPEIHKNHPDTHFLVVGGPAANKPDYAPALHTRCKELGISDKVTFTGIRKDIPSILAASTVLVLPSITPEPFGRTIVEAMAAACPVIATAAGGPLQIIVDGETGHLVPPEDHQSLATQIGCILKDPAKARHMGMQGKSRAKELFSLQRLVRDMADLFEDPYKNG
jgi:glycosyltransferase involved in cell wall biosynthesis